MSNSAHHIFMNVTNKNKIISSWDCTCESYYKCRILWHKTLQTTHYTTSFEDVKKKNNALTFCHVIGTSYVKFFLYLWLYCCGTCQLSNFKNVERGGIKSRGKKGDLTACDWAFLYVFFLSISSEYLLSLLEK